MFEVIYMINENVVHNYNYDINIPVPRSGDVVLIEKIRYRVKFAALDITRKVYAIMLEYY